MFGGDPFDPFSHMRHHMAEMDQMMTDPFGMMDRMMGGMLAGHPMLEGQQHQRQPQQHRRPQNALDLFGGFGGFGMGGGLMRMMDSAMDDPNSMVFSQSTCITMGPDGRQRVVSNSTRKAGDVRETRHSLRDGEEERVSVGHHIGDRAHYIDKKRDRDGKVRQNQRFVNLDEDAAEHFNSEFKNRATRNMTFDPFARNARTHNALENGGHRSSNRSSRSRPYVVEDRRAGSSSNAPIVEIPDDDDDSYVPDNGNLHRGSRQDGPVIRELSEEEAEMESSKRRKGMAGKFFKN